MIIELLDIACLFVSFFFVFFFSYIPGHVPKMECHYVCLLDL